MIPLVLFISFFGLFGSVEKNDKKKKSEAETDCYYIQNFYFREKDYLLIDRNQDALLSFAEAKVYRIGLFLETDTDKNGQIHFREFEKSMWEIAKDPKCRDKKIKKSYSEKLFLEYLKIDINKDTTVIPSEYETYGSYSFDLIDANDDNYVDFEELQNFHAN